MFGHNSWTHFSLEESRVFSANQPYINDSSPAGGNYWRFTEKNRDFYESNPRLSLLTRSLDRMDSDRKKKIFNEAEKFIKSHTK